MTENQWLKNPKTAVTRETRETRENLKPVKPEIQDHYHNTAERIEQLLNHFDTIHAAVGERPPEATPQERANHIYNNLVKNFESLTKDAKAAKVDPTKIAAVQDIFTKHKEAAADLPTVQKLEYCLEMHKDLKNLQGLYPHKYLVEKFESLINDAIKAGSHQEEIISYRILLNKYQKNVDNPPSTEIFDNLTRLEGLRAQQIIKDFKTIYDDEGKLLSGDTSEKQAQHIYDDLDTEFGSLMKDAKETSVDRNVIVSLQATFKKHKENAADSSTLQKLQKCNEMYEILEQLKKLYEDSPEREIIKDFEYSEEERVPEGTLEEQAQYIDDYLVEKFPSSIERATEAGVGLKEIKEIISSIKQVIEAGVGPKEVEKIPSSIEQPTEADVDRKEIAAFQITFKQRMQDANYSSTQEKLQKCNKLLKELRKLNTLYEDSSAGQTIKKFADAYRAEGRELPEGTLEQQAQYIHDYLNEKIPSSIEEATKEGVGLEKLEKIISSIEQPTETGVEPTELKPILKKGPKEGTDKSRHIKFTDQGPSTFQTGSEEIPSSIERATSEKIKKLQTIFKQCMQDAKYSSTQEKLQKYNEMYDILERINKVREKSPAQEIIDFFKPIYAAEEKILPEGTRQEKAQHIYDTLDNNFESLTKDAEKAGVDRGEITAVQATFKKHKENAADSSTLQKLQKCNEMHDTIIQLKKLYENSPALRIINSFKKIYNVKGGTLEQQAQDIYNNLAKEFKPSIERAKEVGVDPEKIARFENASQNRIDAARNLPISHKLRHCAELYQDLQELNTLYKTSREKLGNRIEELAKTNNVQESSDQKITVQDCKKILEDKFRFYRLITTGMATSKEQEKALNDIYKVLNSEESVPLHERVEDYINASQKLKDIIPQLDRQIGKQIGQRLGPIHGQKQGNLYKIFDPKQLKDLAQRVGKTENMEKKLAVYQCTTHSPTLLVMSKINKALKDSSHAELGAKALKIGRTAAFRAKKRNNQ